MENLVGKRFGMLVVTREAPPAYTSKGYKVKQWYCDCDCGKHDHIVRQSNLKHTKSCGCERYLNLVGKRFGKLTTLYENGKTNSGLKIFHCICDCGNECDVIGAYLKNGTTSSCGCYQKESASNRLRKQNKYVLKDDYGIGYTSKGEEFYFDIENYDKIKDYCWFITSDGYVSARDIKNDKSKHILMHQLIVGRYCDHIGGKDTKTDNRKSNLRIPDGIYSFETYNNMNRGLYQSNKSGCTGVIWHKRDSVWESYISVDNRRIYLGRYDDYNEAVKARKEAEEKYFGEYSYDNSMKYANENKI